MRATLIRGAWRAKGRVAMSTSGIGTERPSAGILHEVEKPARYTGGEVGSVVKPWTADVATFCLAFPDVYDIGMSHLGFRILYKILNDDPQTLTELSHFFFFF